MWLNENYLGRWTRLYGPMGWPLRSLDITSLDYYIQGCLKNKAYSQPINSREELIKKIEKACQYMRENPPEIERAVKSVCYRSRLCNREEGSHIDGIVSVINY
ncbi:hypothetical protein ABEB36_005026 [Hypothenemus hampei]|uniref:Uncharacterized protein n=1 Tax=Hypothenemus hampei TaxID=57062 RepID=A0ABD1EWS3_HYPHA